MEISRVSGSLLDGNQQRDAWQRSQSVSLIDRLFGGRLAPLVAQFASQRKLSKTDIAALKALLKEHSRD